MHPLLRVRCPCTACFFATKIERSEISAMECAIKLENITKTFGEVIANKNVNIEINRGEILALLGENGSGKTTLMNIISGIYFPDSGNIFVNGQEVTIRSPKDALNHGIGMIHQHFKLVNVFTAAENIVLGIDDGKFNMKAATKKINEICEKYGFDIKPEQKVYNMTVSQKQTLEIVKVLYRGADILILDEPTAVLTPQETKKLFKILNNMKNDGKAIVIITHKLHEVLSVSDKVAILRKGEYINTVNTSETTEMSLTEMMVGEKVELNIERKEPKNTVKRLEIKNLSCYSEDGVKKLDNVTFTAYGGEILGIAGISGCGEKELLESVAGLQITGEGSSIVFYPPEKEDNPQQLVGKTPKAIRQTGVLLSFVPEDRLGMGLVGSMGMIGNMMLKSYENGKTQLIERKAPKELAETVKEELGVITPSIDTPVSRLSGGNVQKVLVGREISASPAVLMTAYAVRGLDINTSYTIYNLLNKQKENGVAVIYVGEDLDVLIDLCDRILVLCGGKVNGLVDARKTTKEELGMMMTSMQDGGADDDN